MCLFDHHHRWRTANDDDAEDTLTAEERKKTTHRKKIKDREESYSFHELEHALTSSRKMAATMLAMPLDGKDWDWKQRGREKAGREAERKAFQ